jgi:hypothetical protein
MPGRQLRTALSTPHALVDATEGPFVRDEERPYGEEGHEKRQMTVPSTGSAHRRTRGAVG